MRRLLLPILTCVPLLLAGNAEAQTAREVTYTPQSVVQLRAKLRFTTMVILPDDEEILDFVCGDKEFWVVSGGQNLAYIKPAKAGVTTNLNLVTASGHVYSFVLTEGTADPDLKVFVTPDESMKASTGAQRFYSAAQIDALKREIDDARRDAEDARKQADTAREAATKTIAEQVNQFRATYPTELQFPYRFKANERPFFVSAIYTDGKFTYIRAGTTELPSLYELRDGAPNLVNFTVEHGVYIVPKVLERGYLIIGSHKLDFATARGLEASHDSKF